MIKRAIHSIRFTLTLVVCIVVASVWISATAPPDHNALIARYGYSLHNMLAGRWWVLVTMLLPWQVTTVHVVATINFLVLLGACEWLMGTRTTATIYLAGHLLTLLATTVVLLLIVMRNRATAEYFVEITDTGTSVGALCCVSAVLARWPRLWPFALMVGVGLVAWAIYAVILYNIEHAVAFPIGYTLGNALIARRAPPD